MTEGFEKLFDRNFSEEEVGLPCPFEALGDIVHSIEKSRYWLIGGMSGTGKTALIDDLHVIELFDWWYKEYNCSTKDFKITWIYNSMERNRDLKIAKWYCLKLYKDTGDLISSATMTGNTKRSQRPELVKENELLRKHQSLIRSYKTYFAKLAEHMYLYDGLINPTGISKRCEEYFNKTGKLVNTDKYHRRYEPTHPNDYVFCINDHIGLIKTEKNSDHYLTDKGILDKHIEYMRILRDTYKAIIVDISQFNRNLADSTRKRNDDMYPTTADFKGTSNGVEAADYILALFNPAKFKLDEFNGYDISKFTDENGINRYRDIEILKNSYGIDDVGLSYGFLGECGKYIELPDSDKFDADRALRRKFGKLLNLDLI